ELDLEEIRAPGEVQIRNRSDRQRRKPGGPAAVLERFRPPGNAPGADRSRVLCLRTDARWNDAFAHLSFFARRLGKFPDRIPRRPRRDCEGTWKPQRTRTSPPFLRQLLSCVAVRLFQRFIRRFECTTTIRHRADLRSN